MRDKRQLSTLTELTEKLLGYLRSNIFTTIPWLPAFDLCVELVVDK